MARVMDLIVMIRATETVSRVVGQIEHKIEHLNASVKNTAAMRQFGTNIGLLGAGMAAAGVGLAIPLKSGIEAAIEMQGEMAHVATAMDDGAKIGAHLAEVHEKVNALAAAGVIGNIQLADSYYIARSNMLGHADALKAVAAAAALVTGTTKTAADAQMQMEPTTRTLTTLTQNFGGSISGYADQLAKLQTKYAFADIGEVTNALQYAMPAAKGAGVAVNQMNAALALLSQSGLHGAEAGTAFQEFVSKLAVGGKLHGFAATTKEGGLDLEASLRRFATTFGNMPKLLQAREFKELGFGERDIKGVELMMSKVGEFKGVADTMENSKGATAAAAATRMAASDEQFAKLKNQFGLLLEQMGEILLPTVEKVTGALATLLSKISAFGKAHPTIAKYAIGFTAISSVLLIVTGGLALMAGGIAIVASYIPALTTMLGLFHGTKVATKAASEAFAHFGIVKPSMSGLFDIFKAIPRARGMLGTLGTALRTMTWGGFIGGIGSAASAVWTFTAALLANPIFLAIAAIVALGVAGYELYKHWAAVKALFNNIFGGFITQAKTSFGNMGAAISNIASSIYGGLSAGVGGVGHFISYLGSTFHSGLSSIGAYLHAHWQTLLIGAMTGPLGLILVAIKALFPQLFDAGVQLMKSLGAGIWSAVTWPVRAVASVAEKVKGYFVGHSPPPVGPLHQIDHTNIIETIAGSLRPEPLLAAIRRIAAAAAVAIPMMATTPIIASAAVVPRTYAASAAMSAPAYPALASPRSGLTAPNAPTLPAPTTMFSLAPLPPLSVTARAGAAASAGPGGSVTVNLTYTAASVAIHATPETDIEAVKRAVGEVLERDHDKLVEVIQRSLVRKQRTEYW